MAAMLIGVDAHKVLNTAVAISAAKEPLGELRAVPAMFRHGGCWMAVSARRC